jgi:hypothetical protein
VIKALSLAQPMRDVCGLPESECSGAPDAASSSTICQTIQKELNHSAQCCAPALHWVNVANKSINSEGVELFYHLFDETPLW